MNQPELKKTFQARVTSSNDGSESIHETTISVVLKSSGVLKSIFKSPVILSFINGLKSSEFYFFWLQDMLKGGFFPVAMAH